MRMRKFRAKNPAKVFYQNRPFIFWDGEGPRDTGYSLFGNSEGYEICHPNISSQECFDLLLETATDHPKSIHVIFGGNYDVSMWLKDLSPRHLRQLYATNHTIWKGYRIEHIPRKWFTISNGKVSVTVFDIVSFFATTFLNALIEFKIGNPDDLARIEADKARRNEFLWAEIQEIREYWLLELKYGVLLIEALRERFHNAGFHPKSWHGPGALAREALKRHNIKAAMAVCPQPVRLAALFAFAGGRFEMPRGGFIDEPIYNYDLRSAYPAYARELPNLSRGRWVYTCDYVPGKLGIWHIEYHASSRRRDGSAIFPLFRRMQNGEVHWPADVEGWYHAPEADLVKDDPDAKIIEGWMFIEDDKNDRPFSWIEEYYHKRQVLKSINDPAQLTFKLIINSIYGQLAQRVGWNKRTRKPPGYHQLEWAGYITSACRAEVYKAACAVGSELVSIDTDGIYTTVPLPEYYNASMGEGLGQWEQNKYKKGLFWQSGIYVLDNGNGFERGKSKSRGIPRGYLEFERLFSAMRAGEAISLSRPSFYGYGLAIRGQFSRLNTWSTETIEYSFGGSGKRFHLRHGCKRICPGNDIHLFSRSPTRSDIDCLSKPHKLPWMASTPEQQEYADMEVMFDLNNLDDEDSWVLDYQKDLTHNLGSL